MSRGFWTPDFGTRFWTVDPRGVGFAQTSPTYHDLRRPIYIRGPVLSMTGRAGDQLRRPASAFRVLSRYLDTLIMCIGTPYMESKNCKCTVVAIVSWELADCYHQKLDNSSNSCGPRVPMAGYLHAGYLSSLNIEAWQGTDCNKILDRRSTLLQQRPISILLDVTG